MIGKLSVTHISSSEDRYVRSCVRTASPMLISTPSSEMASMAVPSASRPFAVRLAAPRSRARRNTALYRLKTPSHQDTARALSKSPHTTYSVHAHPHTPTEPGRLSASRSLPVMGSISPSMQLSAHFGQWLVLSRRGRNVRKSAGGGRSDLRPGEEKLSFDAG